MMTWLTNHAGLVLFIIFILIGFMIYLFNKWDVH